MTRPRLLDLFCCAGGASTGYEWAGFDVTGVDIDPQPRYPYPFRQADAVALLSDPAERSWLDTFDVVTASPPCQVFSDLHTLKAVAAGIEAGRHVDLLAPTRSGLAAWADRTGRPYVIENVVGAPLIDPLRLCGTEFGMTTVTGARGRVWLQRHRLFESNRWLMGAGGCSCAAYRGGRIIGVYGHGGAKATPDARPEGERGWKGSFRDRCNVMGIDWMTRHELAQAIPPQYTEHIGRQLIDQLTERVGT